MSNQSRKDSGENILIKAIENEFLRGIKLFGMLDDDTYTKKSYGVGSIGSHFRHNLDFVTNLLDGIETGKVDYNERERDLRVETDSDYAKERFLSSLEKLNTISQSDFSQKLVVCSELNVDEWYESSLARELEFLHSHTVHHFALIAEKLHYFGIKVSGDFGVAPSTLRFWSEKHETAKTA